MVTDPSVFFDRKGPLSRVLAGYEERPAQRKLSEAVAEVLDAGGLLLAEAGTGTGKTLAYLLPAVELGRRVVVSTGTKNLQEQLVQKDIPILARALGRDLNVAVMKGRANYLCLLRFSSFAKAGTFRRLEEIPVFRAVEAWAPETQTGRPRPRSPTCRTASTSGARSRPPARTASASPARSSTRAS